MAAAPSKTCVVAQNCWCDRKGRLVAAHAVGPRRGGHGRPKDMRVARNAAANDDHLRVQHAPQRCDADSEVAPAFAQDLAGEVVGTGFGTHEGLGAPRGPDRPGPSTAPRSPRHAPAALEPCAPKRCRTPSLQGTRRLRMDTAAPPAPPPGGRSLPRTLECRRTRVHRARGPHRRPFPASPSPSPASLCRCRIRTRPARRGRRHCGPTRGDPRWP